MGLCFNILVDSSVADPFMSMGSALVRDLHVNEVNEKPARAPGLPPASVQFPPQSLTRALSLSLSSQSRSNLRESICEASITLFKIASHFVLRFPWMRVLGGGLWGREERGARRVTGGRLSEALIIIIRAAHGSPLHCYPRMMDRGPCDYPSKP